MIRGREKNYVGAPKTDSEDIREMQTTAKRVGKTHNDLCRYLTHNAFPALEKQIRSRGTANLRSFTVDLPFYQK